MERLIRFACKFLVLLVVSLIFVGCGALEDEDKEVTFDAFLDDPDYYRPGDSVRGGDFSFIDVKVKGFIRDPETNTFKEIQDGSYVPPGTHRIGIKTTARRDPSLLTSEYDGLSDLIQGSAMDQRVYASDGGNEYLIEATLDQASGLYVCDFKVDGKYPVCPLLIEVIYRDGMAAKEKIVLSTRNSIRAPVNKLVKEGLAITLNTDFALDVVSWAAKDQEMINSLLGVAGSFLCDWNVAWIQSIVDIDFLMNNLVPLLLRIGDVTPGDNSIADVHIRSLKGLATVGLGIEDIYEDGDIVQGPLPIEFPVSAATINLEFVDWIAQEIVSWLLLIMDEPIALNLDTILDPIADDLFDEVLDIADIKIEYAEMLASELFDSILPTNMTAFLNAFAKPAENTDKLAVVYAGAFLTDSRDLPDADELALGGRCFPDWPDDVIMDATTSLDISPVKNETTDLGIAISGYEINSIIGQLGDIYELSVPPTITNIAFALINNLKATSSSMLTGKVEFNPYGLTVDVKDSEGTVEMVLMANDLVLTLEDNGAPVTVINMDMVFDITMSFRWKNDSYFIDVGLTLVPEMSHIHVINDKIGVVFLDHSTFLKSIVEVIFLGEPFPGDAQQIKLPINITHLLGLLPKQEGTTISAKDGNVYVNFALDHENPISYDVLGAWLTAIFN